MINLLITYLLLVNILGFSSMFIDKKRAINHKWRISEKTLILIALIGGSLGSILGMKTFRHKTKHLKFSLGLPIIIILQITIVLYLLLYK